MFPKTYLKRIFSKYWDYFILATIVILAAAIRLYHFHDWLFFAMDQARDAMLVRGAYENGVSQLPLLGPRAAGTYLRLGPAFYYFQFISTKIFRSIEPPVFAYPDLVFSILAVPLFYFFLRLYFSKFISLLATITLAFSFVGIQYSRFAWNPNSVPFWTLVCLYGLARFSAAEGRGKYWWLVLAAVGLAVASQLHFLSFLALPIVVLLFLFLVRGFAKAGWRGLGLALGVVAFFYLPMILSEFATGGDNIGQFIFALSAKPQNQSLWASFVQNAKMHGQYYFLFLSSYTSRSFLPSVIAGIVLIGGGTAYAVLNYFFEKNTGRKNFLALVVAWLIISFLILIPFSFESQPRFFFIAFGLPFVMFAFWLDGLKKYLRRKHFFAAVSVFSVLALVGLNVEGASAWYRALAENSQPSGIRNRVLVIKQSDNLGFTLSDLEKVSDYLSQEGPKKGGKFFISANMSYRVPIQYLLEKKSPPTDYRITGRRDTDPSFSYYSIRIEKPGMQPVSRKLRDKFEVIGKSEFGKFSVYELKLKDVQPKIKKEKDAPADQPAEIEKEKPRRTERIFWGDIF